MRILVLSDTHRKLKRVMNLLKKIQDIDVIIHLGDNTVDARSIVDETDIPVYYIKGNCDIDNVKSEDIITLEGKRIFITHGHLYNVNTTLITLCYRAEEVNADICLYGHTHIPMIEDYNGIFIINPGSITEPRGGSKYSYGLIEINDDEINAEICEVQ